MPPEPDSESPFTIELQDITPPDAFSPQPGTAWWIYLCIFCFLLLVAVGARILYLNHRAQQKRTTSDLLWNSYAKARSTIDAVTSGEMTAGEMATALSLALRTYLAETSSDPSLFLTHEEFVLSEQALEALPDLGRTRAIEYFSRLAELKYGQISSNSNHEDLAAEAHLLLSALDAHHPSRRTVETSV